MKSSTNEAKVSENHLLIMKDTCPYQRGRENYAERGKERSRQKNKDRDRTTRISGCTVGFQPAGQGCVLRAAAAQFVARLSH